MIKLDPTIISREVKQPEKPPPQQDAEIYLEREGETKVKAKTKKEKQEFNSLVDNNVVEVFAVDESEKIRTFLREHDVKFDARLGVKKLKLLKQKYEDSRA